MKNKPIIEYIGNRKETLKEKLQNIGDNILWFLFEKKLGYFFFIIGLLTITCLLISLIDKKAAIGIYTGGFIGAIILGITFNPDEE